VSDFLVGAEGFDRLAADLGAVADDAHVNVRKATEHTADATAKGWNERLYTDGHAKLTGKAVDTTITEGVLGVAADIGARRGSGRQAGIVRLLEHGSVHNAPHGAGAAALEEQLPDFEARLGLALWAGLKDHDL
jgi:hypothetical protein